MVKCMRAAWHPTLEPYREPSVISSLVSVSHSARSASDGVMTQERTPAPIGLLKENSSFLAEMPIHIYGRTRLPHKPSGRTGAPDRLARALYVMTPAAGEQGVSVTISADLSGVPVTKSRRTKMASREPTSGEMMSC
jgi:hypothetical protein